MKTTKLAKVLVGSRPVVICLAVVCIAVLEIHAASIWVSRLNSGPAQHQAQPTADLGAMWNSLAQSR